MDPQYTLAQGTEALPSSRRRSWKVSSRWGDYGLGQLDGEDVWLSPEGLVSSIRSDFGPLLYHELLQDPNVAATVNILPCEKFHRAMYRHLPPPISKILFLKV